MVFILKARTTSSSASTTLSSSDPTRSRRLQAAAKSMPSSQHACPRPGSTFFFFTTVLNCSRCSLSTIDHIMLAEDMRAQAGGAGGVTRTMWIWTSFRDTAVAPYPLKSHTLGQPPYLPAASHAGPHMRHCSIHRRTLVSKAPQEVPACSLPGYSHGRSLTCAAGEKH